MASDTVEAAMNVATGPAWADTNKYVGGIAGEIVSSGPKAGVTKAVGGAVNAGLNLVPQAMGYASPEKGSVGDKLNQATSNAIAAAATRGGAAGAITAAAEPLIRAGMDAVPQAAGYASPQTGSMGDRLNRFGSRVAAGAVGGALVGSVTGPGAAATALVGAVGGGLYDLAETGMEIAKYAFNSQSGGPQPSQKPAIANLSGPPAPAIPTEVPKNTYANSTLGRSSQVLATAFN
jgi:hypothetical protein